MPSSIPTAAYLHIPFCRRRCFYCDFPISVLGDQARGETSPSIQAYVEVLCQEIRATSSSGHPLDTIFFGGGTPSLLSPQQLATLIDTVAEVLGLNPNAEISIEMDPGTFDLGQLQDYLRAGINRISLGGQAFQDELLVRCGRSHTVADIFESVQFLQRTGFENYSLDLMSGLPTQTMNQWEASLRQVVALEPKHLSCYDLVLETQTVFGKQHEKGNLSLPTDETAAQMYRIASEYLRASGFIHYEISNYAQPGYRCRHNLTYWQNQDFYGFGMGAASYLKHRRVSRPKTRQAYFDWVQMLQNNPTQFFENMEPLTWGDRLFETLMVGLRLAEGLSLSALAREFGSTIVQPIIHGLLPFEKKEWVIIERAMSSGETHIRLTDPEGFLYSNQILVDLWESLDHQGITQPA